VQANRDSKIGYGMSELVQLRRQSSGLLGRSGPDLSGMNADKSRLACAASVETRGEPADFYGEVDVCKTKGPTGNWPRSFGIRLPEPLLAEIARWSKRSDAASCSEAMSCLVEIGLRFNGEKLDAGRRGSDR
jgi:hypothetical protein